MPEREIVFRTIPERRKKFIPERSFKNTVILTEGLICDISPNNLKKGKNKAVEEKEFLMQQFEAFGLYVGSSDATIHDAARIRGVTGENFRKVDFENAVREVIKREPSLEGVSPQIFGLKHSHYDYREKRARVVAERRGAKKKEEPPRQKRLSKYERLKDPSITKDEAEEIMRRMPAGSTTRYRRLGLVASVRNFASSLGLGVSYDNTQVLCEFLSQNGVAAACSPGRQGDFSGYNLWSEEGNLQKARLIIEEIRNNGGIRSIKMRTGRNVAI